MADPKHSGDAEQTVDVGLFLQDAIRGFVKYWYVGLLLVAALAAFGGLRQIRSYQPMYRCEASFTVNTQQAGTSDYDYSFYYDKTTASQLVSTFPYILQSDLLTDRIKEDLKMSYIPGIIQANPVSNSNLFTLSVTGGSPELALAVLNSVVKNYPAVAEYVLGEISLHMIDPPRLPEAPYNQLQWVGASVKYGTLGLMLFLGMLALYALTRTTIRREDEMEQKLRLTSLGVVPQVRFKRRTQKIDTTVSIRNDKTGFGFQECFRGLALRAVSQLQKQGGRILGITAAAEGEGATTVAKNVAIALAEAGKRVIYLDAHFHNPRKRSRRGQGLEAFLEGSCQLADVLVKDKTDTLWMAACTRALTDTELVTFAPRLKALMDAAKNTVDYVIVDLPACDRMGQAAPGIELCDGLLCVIRQDNLKRNRLMDAVEDLNRFDAQLLGGVLNFARGGLGGYGYSYGYSYGKYGYSGRSYGRHGGYGYGYGSRKGKKKGYGYSSYGSAE